MDHILANSGSEPMEVAPWAITQLRLGGRRSSRSTGRLIPTSSKPIAAWCCGRTPTADSRVTFHHGH